MVHSVPAIQTLLIYSSLAGPSTGAMSHVNWRGIREATGVHLFFTPTSARREVQLSGSLFQVINHNLF